MIKLRAENKKIAGLLIKINELKDRIEECRLFLNYFEAEALVSDDIFFNVVMARSYRSEIDELNDEIIKAKREIEYERSLVF